MEGIIDSDPKELLRRCSDDINTLSYCSSTNFWNRKLQQLSLYELQENWILYLAKKHSIKLLDILLTACDEAKIYIDDEVYILAIYHLLEIRGGILQDNLLDKIHDKLTNYVDLDELVDFHNEATRRILNFRKRLEVGELFIWKPVTHIKLWKFDAKKQLNYKYELDYAYRTLNKYLPNLKQYISKLHKVSEALHNSLFSFIVTIFRMWVLNGKENTRIDEIMKYASRYAETTNAPSGGLYNIFQQLQLVLVEDGSYTQFLKWVPLDDLPIITSLRNNGVVPLDKRTYYKLAEYFNYDTNFMASAWRAMRYHADEWISYVSKRRVNGNNLVEILELCQEGAHEANYTDFEELLREVL